MHLLRGGAMRPFQTQTSTRAVDESQREPVFIIVMFETSQAFLLIFCSCKSSSNKDRHWRDVRSQRTQGFYEL